MKRMSPLLACALPAAVLVASVASAQTINVAGLQGANGRPASPDTTGILQPELLGARNNPTGTDTTKSWLQFDLTTVWSTYGQASLQSASLILTTQNGTSRNVDVFGLANSAGLENWDKTTLTWNNAPANDTASTWALDLTKIHGGAPIWQIRGGGVLLNTDPAFVNNSQYTSPDIGAFLAADTDGLVTFIMSGPDGLNSNTRFWNTEGAWQNSPGKISPVLAMTFVPEPATLSLALLGLGGLLLLRRRA